jgi:hypothetical protein
MEAERVRFGSGSVWLVSRRTAFERIAPRRSVEVA